MTGGTAPDTTFAEPPFTAGEAEHLLFAIERSRAQFAWKTGGLDAAGLGHRLPPSALTLGSLLKHLARVEDEKRWLVTGAPPGEPWESVDWTRDPDWDFTSAAEDSPRELYALWRDAVARSRTALAAYLADGGPDRTCRWVLADGSSPSVRRMLVDLHDEYARHVGHADLLREAVDGLVGEDPPQP